MQHQNIITMAKVMEFSEIVRICEQKKQTGDILTLSKMLGYTTELPDTAQGQYWRKMSKIIIRVVGMNAQVGGRCTGGNLVIDEERAMLYHNSNIGNNNSKNQIS